MRTFLIAGAITLAVIVVVAMVGRSVAPDSFRLPEPEATVTVTATPQVVATVTATATVTAIVTPAPSGGSGAGGGQVSGSETPAATPSPGSGSPVQWAKMATVSGTAHKKSAVFRLRGDAQKLRWKLGGKGQPFAHIYVTDADSLVFSTVPDAAPDVRGPGSTLLHLEKGRYYLDVYSESTWSVTIWDAR
jgi:hypothetical protein